MMQAATGETRLHVAGLRAAGEIVSARLAAVVTDETVAALYFDELAASLRAAGTGVCKIVLPAGEHTKSEKYLFELYGKLAACGVSREDVIVALGGGTIGDLAGFAAATYLRGVRFVNCPTTLLAQCDSAIGGKTCIDLPAGKNLVGAFYPAEAVIADPETLATLPESDLASGMAEVIKCGCIADESLLNVVAARDYAEMVRRAVAIKEKYVALDPFDRGARHALNFGHTVGHALEAYSGYSLPHGYGVAVGMAAMARIGEHMGFTMPGTSTKLCHALDNARLTYNISTYNISDIFPYILRDKKAIGQNLHLALLKRLGEAEIVEIPITQFRSELARLCI